MKKRNAIVLIAVFLAAALGILLYSGVSANVKNLLAEQRKLNYANDLFEHGYYKNAINAYKSIDSYAEVIGNIEEAEKQLAMESAGEDSDEQPVYTKVATESVTYTWYVKDPGSDVWFESKVKSSTYSCNMTEEKSGRQVYCVITDAQGNQVTSEITTLTYTGEE